MKGVKQIGRLKRVFSCDCKPHGLNSNSNCCNKKECHSILGMVKPELVIRSPENPNIIYCVEEKNDGIEEIISILVEELRTSMEITIFCRRYCDCSQLYQ